MIIKLLIDGGDMKPGPAIGQKLGPLGINIGQIVQEVNKATQNFKGLKVPVELDIGKDKKFSVKVLSPPTTELIKKELGIDKASGEAKKTKVANASIEQIISVAKIKHANMLDNDFKSAVKSVVGSCVSAGILIENKEAKEIEKDIDAGEYNAEISEMKTETSPEKRKKLDNYFKETQEQQQLRLKKEEEAKAAAEAEKTAAAGTEAKTEKKEESAEEGKPGTKKEEKPAAKK